MTQDTLFGISAAIATPFDENGAIDVDRLAAHSLNLLESGCSSLTYFGTTGEGPSLSMEERAQTVSAMVKAGVPGDKINLAIIVSSLGDALKEARHGIANGCAALLVAPTSKSQTLLCGATKFVFVSARGSFTGLMLHCKFRSVRPIKTPFGVHFIG